MLVLSLTCTPRNVKIAASMLPIGEKLSHSVVSYYWKPDDNIFAFSFLQKSNPKHQENMLLHFSVELIYSDMIFMTGPGTGPISAIRNLQKLS